MLLPEYTSTLELEQDDPPLLGREGELARLRHLLRSSRVVLVVEERAGAGGLRLLREYAGRYASAGDLWLVDPARILGEAYPPVFGLAHTLKELGRGDEGVLVFDGLAPLLHASSTQLAPRAAEQVEVAAILGATLRRCPRVQVVVRCTHEEYLAAVPGTPLDMGWPVLELAPLDEAETVGVLEYVVLARWPDIPMGDAALAEAASLGARDPRLALPGAAVRILARCAERFVAGADSLSPLDVQRAVASQRRLAKAPPGRLGLSDRRRGLEWVMLPSEVMREVKELLGSVRARARLGEWGFDRELLGHASAALFYGEPGTGKSLTAEAVSRELGRPLCRVDAAGIISKWIGESEKQVQDAFAFARATGAVLLLDEADALLGRRGTSDSSGDRVANSVVDQLLQEIDTFEGVVILTTNMEHALDPALRRRMGFSVSFPMPAAATRARIWRRLLPAEAPLAADVNPAALGREFALSGRVIRNAIVRAATKAADPDRPGPARITMHLLRQAARAQLDRKATEEPAGFRVPTVKAPAARRVATAAVARK